MDNAITTVVAPLIGLSCWGVDRVQGSILSFQFGAPRLLVREPYPSTSSSAKVRQRSAQRLVKPVGEWNLFIFACHWRIVASGDTLAEDADAHARIEAAANMLNGQKLAAFTLDVASHKTTFLFDLGATLTTSPYRADEDEQWSLYLPGNRVLSYRADGCHSLGPSDEKPDQEVWHPAARGVVPVTITSMDEALRIQAQARQELAASLADIPGGCELIDWFEGETEFGDAEIVGLLFDRRGSSALRIALDRRGKSAIVVFELAAWIDVDLRGFSHQNVISGLKLRRAGDRDVQLWDVGVGLDPGEWLIELEPCFGANGTIRANIARIVIERAPDRPHA